MNSYCCENLADLTIKGVQNELVENVMPSLVAPAQAGGEVSNEQTTLNRHRNSPPSANTVWRWMRLLGWRHDTRKKTFYVDGHEKPAQKQDRQEHCEKYLTELEPRAHRWTQVTVTQARTWMDEGNLGSINVMTTGCHYKNEESNDDMIEFHVDQHEFLQEQASQQHTHGGNLSV